MGHRQISSPSVLSIWSQNELATRLGSYNEADIAYILEGPWYSSPELCDFGLKCILSSLFRLKLAVQKIRNPLGRKFLHLVWPMMFYCSTCITQTDLY